MSGPDRDLQLPGNRTVPASIYDFDFVRSSGPGGQRGDKASTKAVLTVTIEDLLPILPDPAVRRLRNVASRYLAGDRLIITSQATRSQARTRSRCIDKLETVLRKAMKKPRRRRRTRPTRGSRERRLKAKKHRGKIKKLRKPPKRRDW